MPTDDGPPPYLPPPEPTIEPPLLPPRTVVPPVIPPAAVPPSEWTASGPAFGSDPTTSFPPPPSGYNPDSAGGYGLPPSAGYGTPAPAEYGAPSSADYGPPPSTNPDAAGSAAGSAGGRGASRAVFIAGGIAMVALVAVAAWALFGRGGSGGEWILVQDDRPRPSFHLLRPNESPTPNNEIDLRAERFSPVSHVPWSFDRSSGMGYIFGTATQSQRSSFIAIEIKTGEVITILDRSDWYDAMVAGDTVLVAEGDGGDRKRAVNAADPRNPIALGAGQRWEVSPDGGWVTRRTDTGYAIVNPRNGDEIGSVRADQLIFTADGNHFATYSEEGRVSLYRSRDVSHLATSDIRVGRSCWGCVVWNEIGTALILGDESIELLTTGGDSVRINDVVPSPPAIGGVTRFVDPRRNDVLTFGDLDDFGNPQSLVQYVSATGELKEYGELATPLLVIDRNSQNFDGAAPFVIFDDGQVERVATQGENSAVLQSDLIDIQYSFGYQLDSASLILLEGFQSSDNWQVQTEVWRVVDGRPAERLLDERGELSDFGQTGDLIWVVIGDGDSYLFTSNGTEAFRDADRADSVGSPVMFGGSLYYAVREQSHSDIFRFSLDTRRAERAHEGFSLLASSGY